MLYFARLIHKVISFDHFYDLRSSSVPHCVNLKLFVSHLYETTSGIIINLHVCIVLSIKLVVNFGSDQENKAVTLDFL